MSQDDYIKSRVDAIKSLVDSIATSEELVDNDIASIINAGILEMQERVHYTKQRYQQLEKIRANRK